MAHEPGLSSDVFVAPPDPVEPYSNETGRVVVTLPRPGVPAQASFDLRRYPLLAGVEPTEDGLLATFAAPLDPSALTLKVWAYPEWQDYFEVVATYETSQRLRLRVRDRRQPGEVWVPGVRVGFRFDRK